MKKFIFSFLFLFSLSFAKEIYIEKLEIKNLPDNYLEIFKNFFNENVKPKKENLSLEIKINWLSYSYNICIFIKENKTLREAVCTTSNNAEEIRDNLKDLLDDNKYIYLNNIPVKKVNLTVLSKGKTTEKKVKLISSKGDYLTDYKEKINLPKEPSIMIGGATASVDLIILNELSSTFILKKLLNNYKIDKIYINN